MPAGSAVSRSLSGISTGDASATFAENALPCSQSDAGAGGGTWPSSANCRVSKVHGRVTVCTAKNRKSSQSPFRGSSLGLLPLAGFGWNRMLRSFWMSLVAVKSSLVSLSLLDMSVELRCRVQTAASSAALAKERYRLSVSTINTPEA